MNAQQKKMVEQMRKGKKMHEHSLDVQKQSVAVLGGNIITGLMLDCEKRMAKPTLTMLSEDELDAFRAAAEHSIKLIEKRKAELKLVGKSGGSDA